MTRNFNQWWSSITLISTIKSCIQKVADQAVWKTNLAENL